MRRLGYLVIGVLLGTSATTAQAFEGPLKWRIVRVDKAALAKVAGDASDADKVFAVPLETIMSMHGDAVVTDATVYIKGGKVRADTTARDGQNYYLTDLDSGTTLVVMPKEKKVMEVGHKDVELMEQRASSMRALLQRQMEAMSPEKRKNAAAILGSDEASAAVDLVELGKTQTINGMQTNAFAVRGGKDTIVGWVSPGHAEVLEVFKKMERSRAQLGSRSGPQPKSVLAQKGLPVRVQTLDDHQYILDDLVLIEEKPISDDLFAVPANFAKTTAREAMEQAGQPPGKKK